MLYLTHWQLWLVSAYLVAYLSYQEVILVMGRFELIVSMIDGVLDTKRKRHIIGGTLLSTSLFFGGLALTVMTLKTERRLING